MSGISSDNLKMEVPEISLSLVSDNLLSFLREEAGESKIDYEIPLSKLQGGFDTSVFHFKLKNIHAPLSGPLVLRIFRKTHPLRQAIMESIIQNSMKRQGFPVPYVYYACTDDKYLGSQFLIMDFLDGALLPLVFGPETNIVLGRTHAMLHNADPSQLNKDIIAGGFGGPQYGIDGKLDLLIQACDGLRWLEEIVFWLIKNRPSDCEYPAICHLDFHPYNLLARDDKVTAILDWSSCRVGDPAMDVASTMVIFNAATKHLIPSFDAKLETRNYLDAYRGVRDLNEGHLGYYQVLGCALRLLAGTRVVSVWTQVPIQNELINIIYTLSKIHVVVPGKD